MVGTWWLGPWSRVSAADSPNRVQSSAIGDLERDGDIELDGVHYSRHEASIQIANGEVSFDAILRKLFEDARVDAAIWLIARKINQADDVVADTLRSDADGAIMRLVLQTGFDDKTYRDFLKARCVWPPQFRKHNVVDPAKSLLSGRERQSR